MYGRWLYVLNILMHYNFMLITKQIESYRKYIQQQVTN